MTIERKRDFFHRQDAESAKVRQGFYGLNHEEREEHEEHEGIYWIRVLLFGFHIPRGILIGWWREIWALI